jgi:protein-S-isoprenylcysteine O-methyltransferase Ste14
MKNKTDSPGVFFPPPLLYVIIFLLSFILQGYLTIRAAFFFHSLVANIIGIIIIITGLVFSIPALRQFIKSRNTLIPFRPAASLQTNGIYSASRNPMYTGLLFIYLGLALIFGNWWTIILFPLLVVLITYLIILPEERYLMRAFGTSFSDYKNKVRRWI